MLYQRLRPTSFDDVVGNERVKTSLSRHLKDGTLPHFILFTGGSGTGKTTMARIVAQELGATGMDLREMNSAQYRGIDTIRELQKSITLAPFSSPCRVFIMDEVHQYSADAQDAALKMLEDTPKHVYFIWATTDPQKLKKAILTRACVYQVNPLNEHEMVAFLLDAIKAERMAKVPDRIMDQIVEAADGSARSALVMLEQYASSESDDIDFFRADEDKKEGIDLCRALFKCGDRWQPVADVLQNLKGEPENIRRAVLGYARNTLLKDGNHQRAYDVLHHFERNFYDSGTAGLTLACYNVISE